MVTSSYPAHPEDPSGAFVRADVQRLLGRARSVHVLCPAPAVRDPGAVLHSIDGGDAFGWPGLTARLQARPQRLLGVGRFLGGMRDRLRRIGPEVVRAHWLLPAGLACLDLGYSLEVVCHGSDVRLFAALPAWLRLGLAARLAAADVRLQFVAEALRDTWRAATQELDQPVVTWVAPCPLTLPSVGVRADVAGLPPGPYVAVVGRDVPGKRLSLAVSACRRAGLRCVVVGAALDRTFGVVSLGPRPHREAVTVIAHAAALLHPSQAEGAPTVVREARALGVPVVATPAGDVGAWAKTDPGLRVAPAEASALARALLEVVAQPRVQPPAAPTIGPKAQPSAPSPSSAGASPSPPDSSTHV